MPNGKQAKVYEFESWGWSPPALETPVGTTEPATPGDRKNNNMSLNNGDGKYPVRAHRWR